MWDNITGERFFGFFKRAIIAFVRSDHMKFMKCTAWLYLGQIVQPTQSNLWKIHVLVDGTNCKQVKKKKAIPMYHYTCAMVYYIKYN